MDQFSVMMEHVITVYGPPTVARDTGGGTSMTWPTTRASSKICLINAPHGLTRNQFGQDMLVGNAVIATFYVDAQRGDQIEVTAGPTFVGMKLKVIGIKTQPGVEFLGFTPIAHYTCEQVL